MEKGSRIGLYGCRLHGYLEHLKIKQSCGAPAHSHEFLHVNYYIVASYFCLIFLVRGLSHVCVVQSDNIHIVNMTTTESWNGQTSREGGA